MACHNPQLILISAKWQENGMPIADAKMHDIRQGFGTDFCMQLHMPKYAT
jgi:hypothetical protein